MKTENDMTVTVHDCLCLCSFAIWLFFIVVGIIAFTKQEELRDEDNDQHKDR